MRKPLDYKLFIWTEWNPNWTGGLAFAIAKTERGARRQIEKTYPPDFITDWGTLEVLPLTGPLARCVSGGA